MHLCRSSLGCLIRLCGLIRLGLDGAYTASIPLCAVGFVAMIVALVLLEKEKKQMNCTVIAG